MRQEITEFVETSVAAVCSDAILKVAWIEGIAAGLISSALTSIFIWLMIRHYLGRFNAPR